MRRSALKFLLPLLTLPISWPHHLALGLTDPPGDATTLVAHAPLDMRYQYLAGGVNTGAGWATWNPNGSFVSLYVQRVDRRARDPDPDLLPAAPVLSARRHR